VVESGRDRMALLGLSVLVLEDEGARAVEDPGAACGDGGRGAGGLHSLSPGLEAVQGHGLVGDEGGEDRYGVGSATHARGDGVGQPSGAFQDLFSGLGPDDVVQIAYQFWEGVWTGHGTEQVVGAVDVGDPVTEGLVDGRSEERRVGKGGV